MNCNIAIIACYYGTFPCYFPAFLLSCKNNPSVDWLIISDCDFSSFDIPSNVHIIDVSLSEVKKRAESTFGFSVSLEKPYKLCDYKTVYGVLFSDFLSEYEFWGYCDLDVVWGDLRSFITSDILFRYEKVYLFGHLSLIKNSTVCSKVVELNNNSDTVSYEDVFTNKDSFYFDEIDFNKKWFCSGRKVYQVVDCFDRANMYYNRVLSVDSKVMKGAFPNSFMETLAFPKNRLFQIVSWENGKIYRYYLSGLKMKREEYAYIHFRSNLELPKTGLDSCRKYYFTVKKLVPAKGKTTVFDILKYNFPRPLLERKQYNNYMIRQHQRTRFSIRVKETLYSIKPLRKMIHKIKQRRE